jgi:hypothetical protein
MLFAFLLLAACGRVPHAPAEPSSSQPTVDTGSTTPG